MHITKKELKFNLKTFILWCVIISLFVFLYASVTNIFLQQNSSALKFIEKLPKNLLKTFNIDMETLSKPEGLFGTESMVFMFILFGTFSILLSSKILASEFDEKTIEYILLKPLKRKKIFFEKTLAIFIYNILLFFTFFTFEVIFFKTFVEKFSVKVMFGFALYLLSIAIFFSSIAILLSIFIKKRKVVNSLSIAILFLFYFLDTVTKGVKIFASLRKISMFYHLSTIQLVNQHTINYIAVFFIILISFALILVSKKSFETQDILI
ncbi:MULTISPECIES: ABC transporter permease subunit [unclassified Thermosipho (in: thermotogales)]|uniref:ABC transporter permease subunit n=1 Tax=unclassified Thermosipho (in: thermotogales) TaxID=2676525 RepID=UPI0009854F62|nr:MULTISPECIES: ABC transporter permease subunit [unclassified Thermosipho (in: thermotogales)]MBT1247293.1 hypothetical protein [Thermosipho sp. 1244]OOC47147.1 hypothetical protein XO09_03020 [Thermosipho sp. 1223]